MSVTGVDVEAALVLRKGEMHQLQATVYPENATYKKVIWESDNLFAAQVDSNGLVEGVGSGETHITVQTVDGNYEAKCAVQVGVGVD